MPRTRRDFLRDTLLAPALLAPVASSASDYSFSTLAHSERTSLFHSHSNDSFPFKHGVASGDPLTDRVILWTRITPAASEFSVAYRWMVARDPEMADVVNQGDGLTDMNRDFTVKIDADGLRPGTTYYYVFEALGQLSDIGRTKTLPIGSVEHLRIAFTSCSNYTRGYFNVYREIARRHDLDVVLHLGDYIYEYADIDHSLNTGRVQQPVNETVTLEDYRQRHACYKTDKDLQDVHRQHPFMVIWDDHEVANNAWGSPDKGGADNHSLEEGEWHSRLRGAMKAYMEWMPVREQPHKGVYRRFQFGDLADLNMLDTRLAGRDQQEDEAEKRDRPERTLLGYEQETWLYNNLSRAQQGNTVWKLLGQQVMVAQFGLQQTPLNHDQWDGYPAARKRLFDHIEQHNVDNVVVLTGDIHSSWALELHRDPFNNLDNSLAVELVTPAVTSPGISNRVSAHIAAAGFESVMPHLNFTDLYYRGYVLLDIKRERIQAEWWVVDNIDSPRYVSECLRALTIPAGQSHFSPATGISPDKPAAPPAPEFSDSFAYFRQWRQQPSDSVLNGMIAQQSGAAKRSSLP